MSSTVKSGWWLVAGTLGFSILLIVLPHLFFKRDIAAVDKDFWYYIALRIAVFVGWVIMAYETIITREDPGKGGLRALTIGVAALYFIITLAGASQYRSDKSDNIQYDKKTSQVVKMGERTWNI